MIFKNFHLKITALTLSLLALSATSEIFAAPIEHGGRSYDRNHEGVKPAQAIYQDETAFTPVVDQPISFSEKGFKTNFDVNANRSIFEVQVPGLYSIDAFLLVNLPNIGDSVAGYITINERKLLTFFSSETRTLSPVVEFHFNDRLVYLEKGDKVSVVLSEFAQGATVLARGFVMVALNNSH
jgi:hypothetical protein